MDKKLLDILACPSCKGNLIYDKAGQELLCKPCQVAYPIRDDIPLMLESETRPLSEAELEALR